VHKQDDPQSSTGSAECCGIFNNPYIANVHAQLGVSLSLKEFKKNV